MPQDYDYSWSQPYPLPLVNQPLDPPAAVEGVVPLAPAHPSEQPLLSEAQKRPAKRGAEDRGKRPSEGAASPPENEWMLLL
jgi:hypothetical protein